MLPMHLPKNYVMLLVQGTRALDLQVYDGRIRLIYQLGRRLLLHYKLSYFFLHHSNFFVKVLQLLYKVLSIALQESLRDTVEQIVYETRLIGPSQSSF